MTPKQLREYIDARTRQEGACRIWTGGKTGSGQPTMRFKGERRTVRSVVLEVLKGLPHKPGFVASNTCQCSLCVETEHCLQISQAQMLERSRRNTNEEYRAARIAESQSHLRKLTDQDLRNIIVSSEPSTSLAKRLGVHHSLIGRYRKHPPVLIRQYLTRSRSADMRKTEKVGDVTKAKIEAFLEAAKEPVSRAQVARGCGIHESTAGHVINDMVMRGIVWNTVQARNKISLYILESKREKAQPQKSERFVPTAPLEWKPPTSPRVEADAHEGVPSRRASGLVKHQPMMLMASKVKGGESAR